MRIAFPNIVMIVCAALLSGGKAHAEYFEDKDSGWYAGAEMGNSTLDIDEAFWSDSSITSSTLDKEGLSYHVYGAYKLSRFFAVDLGYVHIANTEFNGESNGVNTLWDQGAVNGETRVDGFMLEGTGYIPSGIPRLKFFLKGGLFFSNTLTVHHNTINDIDRFHDDGGTFIGGGGIQIRVWNDWHLRAETQYMVIPLEEKTSIAASYVTIGIMHPIE